MTHDVTIFPALNCRVLLSIKRYFSRFVRIYNERAYIVHYMMDGLSTLQVLEKIERCPQAEPPIFDPR